MSSTGDVVEVVVTGDHLKYIGIILTIYAECNGMHLNATTL